MRGMALCISSWVTIEATGTGGAADELGVWFPEFTRCEPGGFVSRPEGDGGRG